MKILLIDDHALFRAGLRHILQLLPGGVDEIFEAGSCLDGLNLCEQQPDLDMVLLELKTPGCDGETLVKLFHQRYPHIKLIVVSSVEECQVINEVLTYGACGYVCKSSTETTLLNALNLVLAGSVYVPQELLQQPILVETSDGRDSKSKKYGLTARQMKILERLAMGLSNHEIARESNLATGTVKVHVAAVYKALGVSKRVEAAQIARRFGLVGMVH